MKVNSLFNNNSRNEIYHNLMNNFEIYLLNDDENQRKKKIRAMIHLKFEIVQIYVSRKNEYIDVLL